MLQLQEMLQEKESIGGSFARVNHFLAMWFVRTQSDFHSNHMLM